MKVVSKLKSQQASKASPSFPHHLYLLKLKIYKKQIGSFLKGPAILEKERQWTCKMKKNLRKLKAVWWAYRNQNSVGYMEETGGEMGASCFLNQIINGHQNTRMPATKL